MIGIPQSHIHIAACSHDHTWRCQLASDLINAAQQARTPGTSNRHPDASTSIRLLKSHDRGSVWQATLGSRPCVLKCSPMTSLSMKIRHWTRSSPLWRFWYNARWLRHAGFAAAEPLAIVRGHDAAGVAVECLIHAYVPGQTVLAHLAEGDLSARRQLQVSSEIGRLAARLAAAGRFNRDAKLSNLIVTSLHKTGVHLGMIDCGDIRNCQRNSPHAIARMLASGYIEAIGCGLPLRRTLCLRALTAALAGNKQHFTRSDTKNLWDMVKQIVESHGDPTPKDHPIASSDA